MKTPPLLVLVVLVQSYQAVFECLAVMSWMPRLRLALSWLAPSIAAVPDLVEEAAAVVLVGLQREARHCSTRGSEKSTLERQNRTELKRVSRQKVEK
jgi:hypothetical protein